jgi:hypothetical protein
VGAFLAAIAGAVVVGFMVAGFKIIGRHDLYLGIAFEAIPGALIGLGLSWLYGRHLEEHPRRKRRRRPARA